MKYNTMARLCGRAEDGPGLEPVNDPTKTISFAFSREEQSSHGHYSPAATQQVLRCRSAESLNCNQYRRTFIWIF